MLPELIIRGGLIADGSGKPTFRADLAIADGRITEIGTIPHNAEIPYLDATDLLVAPGFIDIHSHSDFTLYADPRAISSITQGVTTEVVGNCGHGSAPIADPELATGNIYGYLAGHDLSWRSMGQYLDSLEQRQPAVNILSLVPNGNLRLATCGLVDRPANADELAKMEKLLAQSLEEGAFGYSTGLEYGPERGCSEEEIATLCRVAASVDSLYATHTRNLEGQAQESIAEAIRASRTAEIALQISHISVVARLQDDGARAIAGALEQVENARAEGHDVGFDMHTRLLGTTHLSAALPPQVLAGDRAAIAHRLQDPATRREIKAHRSIVTALARGDWERIVLYQSQSQPEYSRKSIAEIAVERGVEPLDAICEILLAEIDNLHAPMIIAFSYREEDLRSVFAHPGCMIGSDATALAPNGPLAGCTFHGAYTWAAWFFRHFVRDQGTLAPEEAIRRLTSLPAERLGLEDRGVLRAGKRADLVAFAPETFAESGTTFDPNHLATGVAHVLVNGVVTLKDGTLTGARGGQVLRRN